MGCVLERGKEMTIVLRLEEGMAQKLRSPGYIMFEMWYMAVRRVRPLVGFFNLSEFFSLSFEYSQLSPMARNRFRLSHSPYVRLNHVWERSSRLYMPYKADTWQKAKST